MASQQQTPATKPTPAAAPSNGAPPSFQSRLAAVRTGRMRQPLRIVLYGPEGVGKSSLAAAAPGVIFLDAEGGSEQVAVARYPFRPDEDGGHQPRSYEELLYGIEDLTVSKHEYKAAALDTADKIESLMWRWICRRDSVVSARNPDGRIYSSIEDYGYGKGYTVAIEEWRVMLARLDRLRDVRRMDIIITAHAQIRPFKNPEGEDFDRWQLRIHDRAAGLLKEWADVVGFITYEQGAKKTDERDKRSKAKGWSTGVRLLRTSRHAAFDAKSRLMLDEEVEIPIEDPWAPLAKAIEDSYEDQIPKLVAAIDIEVERIGDAELKAKVAKATKDAVAKKDEMALRRFAINLRSRPAAEAQS